MGNLSQLATISAGGTLGGPTAVGAAQQGAVTVINGDSCGNAPASIPATQSVPVDVSQLMTQNDCSFRVNVTIPEGGETVYIGNGVFDATSSSFAGAVTPNNGTAGGAGNLAINTLNYNTTNTPLMIGCAIEIKLVNAAAIAGGAPELTSVSRSVGPNAGQCTTEVLESTCALCWNQDTNVVYAYPGTQNTALSPLTGYYFTGVAGGVYQIRIYSAGTATVYNFGPNC